MTSKEYLEDLKRLKEKLYNAIAPANELYGYLTAHIEFAQENIEKLEHNVLTFPKGGAK